MRAPTATTLLMPKATALWLIQNTSLTFDQIADFCCLHVLEIQNLADAPEATLRPFDPIASSQLTLSEIKRCEENPKEKLKITVLPLAEDYTKKKSRTHYIPLIKRGLRPSAIAWIVSKYPELPDRVIISLVGTTVRMIESIRDPDYRKAKNIKPESPVISGLCTQEEFDIAVAPYIKSEK